MYWTKNIKKDRLEDSKSSRGVIGQERDWRVTKVSHVASPTVTSDLGADERRLYKGSRIEGLMIYSKDFVQLLSNTIREVYNRES